MESLFNYKSDDENDATQENENKMVLPPPEEECDTNYDNVLMEMSDDSSTSLNVVINYGEERSQGEESVGEIKQCEIDKSSSISSSESYCSIDEETGAIRTRHYRREKRTNGQDNESVDNDSRDRQSDSKSSTDRKYSRSAHVKIPKTLSSVTSEDSESDEDIEPEVTRYHYRDGKKKNKDKRQNRGDIHRNLDRKRYRSRSSERSQKSDRNRSRSPLNDRYHHSSKHSYRSRHSSSRSYDHDRTRNHSPGREKPHTSYESKQKSSISGQERYDIESEVNMTPQVALQKSMEEQMAKMKTITGISLPSYYNPTAINLTKYVEQVQKRKLLWGGTNKQANNMGSVYEPSCSQASSSTGSSTGNRGTSLWEAAKFSQDQDGKLSAKFKRLMGIRQEPSGAEIYTNKTEGYRSAADSNDINKKQEEMFNSMEMQYEVARVATHTHRGLGLGFGIHQFPR